MDYNSTTSTSEIIANDINNFSTKFTHIAPLKNTSFNALYTAERYGKRYVLKGLKDKFQHESIYQQLLFKEFDLSVKWEHPNIVHTIGIEQLDEIGWCIVEEFIDGTTLDEFLKTHPKNSDREKLLSQLLDALRYVHEQQIVHRDLKPANLLVTRNGHNLKIIDFGLSDSDYHTALKQPAGSPKYMAPECINGVQTDCRTDIYAFGILLKQIFPNKYKHMVRRCLAKRSKRYSSIQEIQQTLATRKRIAHYAPVFFAVLICAILLGVYLLFPPKPNPSEIETIAEQKIAAERAKLIQISDSLLAKGIDSVYIQPTEAEIAAIAEKKIAAERNELLRMSDSIITIEMNNVYKRLQAEEINDYNSAYILLSDFYKLSWVQQKIAARNISDQSRCYEFQNMFTLKLSEYAYAYIDSIKVLFPQ